VGRLTGKCALITGGGRGIGRATALMFAREGARVGIMGKGDASVAATQKDAAAQGLEIATFTGDVGTKDDVARVVEAFVAKFGRIDVLVNNAGMSQGRKFADKTVEDWNEVLRVNLIGTFLMAQAVAKHMVAAKSGKIVNVSSVRGLDHLGREGVMDYSAAKAGVINLTKTMAKELAPSRINVNVVVPGHTDTDIYRGLPQEVRDGMIAGTPLGRPGHVDDIAHAITFLASNESDYITGQSIVVDGGFSLKAG
jgi:3-oxoacyl-[acyl-carrier protein] reductase